MPGVPCALGALSGAAYLRRGRRRALPGGCARGARGQAGGPGADRRGEEAAKRRPGLGTAVTPRREIPVEEPPGLARGAGCWPRRSRAVAPSPADAGAARVSGRKRLSHFLRSPPSSTPSAPDLPSLSPAPFPKPAAHVGAGKTRNLNGGGVRRLPPRQVSLCSSIHACLRALQTLSRAPEGPGSAGRLHPVPAL